MKNSNHVDNKIHLSTSFIDYMRAMREHYKAYATENNVRYKGAHFNKAKPDTNLYCFFYKDNDHNDVNNRVRANNIYSFNQNMPIENKPVEPEIAAAFNVVASQQTVKKKSLTQQETIPHETEVIVIKLFEEDDLLTSIDKKTADQQKKRLSLSSKVTRALATLTQTLTSAFK